jgi:hypothetical protein
MYTENDFLYKIELDNDVLFTFYYDHGKFNCHVHNMNQYSGTFYLISAVYFDLVIFLITKINVKHIEKILRLFGSDYNGN